MKFNKIIKKVFMFALLIVVTASVASCNKTVNPTPDPTPTPTNQTIELTASTYEITKGETVALNVVVTNATSNAYTITVSDDTLVSVDSANNLTVIADITLDKIVSVTATLTENTNVTSTKTFKVVAPKVEGQVGELTSEMLQEIGNSSITVTGILTDYYQDFNQSSNSSVNVYDMTVKMSDGRWYGSWNVQGSTNVISDNYQRGSTDGLKDQYGNTGHALERLYIDKNNTVSSAAVTDYLSISSIWEAQHLWNHLSNLQINKFVYDAENDVYEYQIDESNEDDLYLMTYLSFSLTPMLEDTLLKLYLKVEDGKIVKLLGQTEVLYYGDDTNEAADAMSYTTIEVTFSNIGTTVVEDPSPYEAPQYAEKLTAALEKMGNATNYTFRATDTTTYSPSGNEDDYTIESVSTTTSTNAYKYAKAKLGRVANNTSSVGTVGCFGQVTETAALFADTSKYTYTLDGKEYHTEYTGYKQNDDNTYDEFAYDASVGALVGTKKVKGNMFDCMPTFDFSADIFEFAGLTISGGKTQYTFVLRETQITRDIAMEVSCYKYADDATASTSSTVTIVVDDDGNLVSTTYPYSLVSGTYMGYVTTVYSNIGTTTLEEDTFEGYVPRVWKTSWSQYITKYYSSTFSTLDSHEEDTTVVLNAVYGDAASDLPSPEVFMEILGDNIYGPFYNWKSVGQDSEGNDIYHGYISINCTSSEYDENYQITNYFELMAELQEALEAEGFVLSVANTDTTGGESGRSDRVVCFIKNDIQIVITNNFTRYISVYFYKTGDWTLNR